MKKNYNSNVNNHPDLISVENSMTSIIGQHLSELNNLSSKTELMDYMANLFKENNLDTPASRRLLNTIKRSKNFTCALLAVGNSVLSGSNLAVI